MAGTIDSAVTRKSDQKGDENVDKDAKLAQAEAEKQRARQRAEGPHDQAPGAMPPDPAP